MSTKQNEKEEELTEIRGQVADLHKELIAAKSALVDVKSACQEEIQNLESKKLEQIDEGAQGEFFLLLFLLLQLITYKVL